MSRRPGTLITKDPNSTEPQGFDWTDFLEELGSGVEIASSAWFITGPDSALDFDNDEVLSDNMRTQAFFSGGTVGARYNVTNRIVTNSVPPVTEDSSFKYLIQQK